MCTAPRRPYLPFLIRKFPLLHLPATIMLSSSLPAALCAALLITDAVSAVPSNAGSAADPDVHPGKRMVIPLNAPPTPQTDKEIREWRRRQALNLRRKYGAVGYEKRASSASVQLTDLNLDFTYSGAIRVVRVPFQISHHRRRKKRTTLSKKIKAHFIYFLRFRLFSTGNSSSDVQRDLGYRQ